MAITLTDKDLSPRMTEPTDTGNRNWLTIAAVATTLLLVYLLVIL